MFLKTIQPLMSQNVLKKMSPTFCMGHRGDGDIIIETWSPNLWLDLTMSLDFSNLLASATFKLCGHSNINFTGCPSFYNVVTRPVGLTAWLEKLGVSIQSFMINDALLKFFKSKSKLSKKFDKNDNFFQGYSHHKHNN